MAFLKSVIKSQFFGNAHLFVGVPSCPYFFILTFLFFLIFLLLTWECPCCDIFDNSWLLRASQRISSEQFNCIYCLDYKCSVLLQSISEKEAFFFPVSCYSYLPARDSTKVLYLWYSALSLPVFIGMVSFPAMAIDQETPLPQSTENFWFLEAVITDAVSLGFVEFSLCCERSWWDFRLPYWKDT